MLIVCSFSYHIHFCWIQVTGKIAPVKSLDSLSSDGALDLACNSLPGVSVSNEEHAEVLFAPIKCLKVAAAFLCHAMVPCYCLRL